MFWFWFAIENRHTQIQIQTHCTYPSDGMKKNPFNWNEHVFIPLCFVWLWFENMVVKMKLLESNKTELINIRVEICRDTNRIRTLGQLAQNILSRYFNHYKLCRAWFTAKITITPIFSAKIFTLDLVWLASYVFAKKNLSFFLLYYSCRF